MARGVWALELLQQYQTMVGLKAHSHLHPAQ